jgi:hypothetical protein
VTDHDKNHFSDKEVEARNIISIYHHGDRILHIHMGLDLGIETDNNGSKLESSVSSGKTT